MWECMIESHFELISWNFFTIGMVAQNQLVECQGKIYQCSDVTAEAELYGADSSYGYGKTLLFLDEIGEYVDAKRHLETIFGETPQTSHPRVIDQQV